MSSPFLDRSSSEWVASNDLAFAIRDAYAVSPGHTLVVPKRLVPTWFEATAEEQAAIMQLVDEVKRRLDEELHPDGYNVGFNAGAAAGQTVMHLHVHVIPRFRGDMDDPRGGVRHVMPSKGNYLRAPSPLATGGEGDPFMRHLRPLFERATDIAIVAAFIQHSGLLHLEQSITGALKRGARVRVLTGDYLNITQAAALEELLDWTESAQPGGEEGADPDLGEATQPEASSSFEARVIEVAQLEGRTRAFHPKSWRFESDAVGVAFVGSSNISRSALETGIEWNLRVDRDRDSVAYERVRAAFEEIWLKARPLAADWVARHAERSRAESRRLPTWEDEEEAVEEPKAPHPIQLEVLGKLRQTRDEHHRRGLVVMATGLGKTWLAALDVAAFGEEIGACPKVLFLAHRREILKQAARTLRILMRSRWPETRFGWFVGPGGSLAGDVVFASVQKLGRKQYLDTLERHHFDYVVVDEVHHATAPSYQRILDHLEPRFVLGLTATPERSDEADVLGLFDDNLVHRADLGVGIASGHLVPFAYFGLKDDVDYANIPWRNKRFDPAELAKAVQTEQRMARMWRACQEHSGKRTLFFCASVNHADYVRQWLRERGQRVRAVHSGDTADDRSEALRAIELGEVDAVCSVDMLSEGIDIPTVDRVVMLRPTESPVVFLQQLGRGLRKPRGETTKSQLTVIDFVGNHRVFLDRLRRLISLASPEIRDDFRQVLESDGPVDLPHGCSVDVELEAKQLLEALLPKGKSEVERVYRELYTIRGERPTAGELQRMGVLPSTLRSQHESWFDFVASEGHLGSGEQTVLDASRRWLVELERTGMTKCFKMVVVLALLEAGSLRDGMPLEELAVRSHAILARSPELMADVVDPQLFTTLDANNRDAWLQYWTKNPITHWTKPTKVQARRAFALEAGRFVPQFQVPAGQEETFERMTRELVDYRLAQYRARSLTQAEGATFTCKVTWNQRDPILKLPARSGNPSVPRGEVDVRLRDGRVWQFRFAEQFCNVARTIGAKRNELPDLLRSWFGPSAGHPGTGFHVRFSPSPDGWWVEPAGQVIQLASRNHVSAYPDLRAAAGAAEGGQENVQASQVALPIPTVVTAEAAERLFAVRASGSSMDGGKRPIRDGDWLLMRLSRDASLSALEDRVALVELPGDPFGTRYQVKRIQRKDGTWHITSDNPTFVSYPATADAVPIATLVDVVQPEQLAPSEGTLLADDELADAFAVSEPPRTGRVDGHLFICVNGPGAFEAPDRLRFPRPAAAGLPGAPFERRPGETAFVLTRPAGAERWRYAGVARWLDDEGLWALPAVDHATWKELGHGRVASRRLAPDRLDEARALVERLLQSHGAGSWLEAQGKRCRLVGPAKQGGIRIDGGPNGFAERTLSATDIAWVLAAREDVARHGGVLDEARVNRLRYLDGTPRGATRWIDTEWAVVVVNA